MLKYLASGWCRYIPLTLAAGVIAIDVFTPVKKISTIGGVFLGLLAGILGAVAVGFVIELIVELIIQL